MALTKLRRQIITKHKTILVGSLPDEALFTLGEPNCDCIYRAGYYIMHTSTNRECRNVTEYKKCNKCQEDTSTVGISVRRSAFLYEEGD